jgi:hypothetical protein
MALLRHLISIPVAILIGLAIHLDWHLARPMDQRLSAHWSAHWILAVPLFLGVAWYFARRWPVRAGWPLVLTVALGVLIGEVIEPLLEVWAGSTLSQAYAPARVHAFLTFIGTGLLTLILAATGLSLAGRDKHRSSGPAT